VRSARALAHADHRALPVVVSLTGTDADPQNRARCAELLADAGASAFLSNGAATRHALDLLGSQAGTVRQDLDLHVRDVGNGVDGELEERRPSDHDRQQPDREDEEPIAQREVDEARHAGPLCLVRVSATQLGTGGLGLEEEASLDDDLLADVQSARDLSVSLAAGPHLDRHLAIAVGAQRNEHDEGLAAALDRALGHGDHLVRGAGLGARVRIGQAHADEGTWPEFAFPVLDVDSRAQGSCRGVDDIADRVHRHQRGDDESVGQGD